MYISKAQKQTLINDIYDLLSTHTDQTEIFAKIHQKVKTTDSNIYRMLKIALQRYTDDQRAIQTKVMSEHISAINERLKTALYSQEEVLWQLQHLAQKSKRDGDKINALKLICEIQGYKAPEKKDININAHKPIFLDNPLLNGIKQDNKLNT